MHPSTPETFAPFSFELCLDTLKELHQLRLQYGLSADSIMIQSDQRRQNTAHLPKKVSWTSRPFTWFRNIKPLANSTPHDLDAVTVLIKDASYQWLYHRLKVVHPFIEGTEGKEFQLLNNGIQVKPFQWTAFFQEVLNLFNEQSLSRLLKDSIGDQRSLTAFQNPSLFSFEQCLWLERTQQAFWNDESQQWELFHPDRLPVFFETSESLVPSLSTDIVIDRHSVASSHPSLSLSDSAPSFSSRSDPPVPSSSGDSSLEQVDPPSAFPDSKPSNADALLTELRDSLKQPMDHASPFYNLFLINDGTGSGKSFYTQYNFYEQYPNLALKQSSDDLDLSDVAPNGRHHLISITPKKDQFLISTVMMIKSAATRVPVLWWRSVEDLTDLDSKVTFQWDPRTRKHATLRAFYTEWFKQISTKQHSKWDQAFKQWAMERQKKQAKKTSKTHRDASNSSEPFEQLSEELSGQSSFTTLSNDDFMPESSLTLKYPSLSALYHQWLAYLHFKERHAFQKEYNPSEYDREYQECQRQWLNGLNFLAQFLMNCIPDHELEYLVKQRLNLPAVTPVDSPTWTLLRKAPWVADFLFMHRPFSVAQWVNCVIHLTGDKFETLVPFEVDHYLHPGLKVTQYVPLVNLISGYSFQPSFNWLHLNDEQWRSSLKNHTFKPDSRGLYFQGKTIGFSVLMDEEHVLYDIFKKYSFSDVTAEAQPSQHRDTGEPVQQLNLVHAFAGIHRWINNISVQSPSSESIGQSFSVNPSVFHSFHQKKGLINLLLENYSQYTRLKTRSQVLTFLEQLIDNEHGLFIHKHDTEMIESIFNNILSYTPALNINKDFLKSIGLKTPKGSSFILLEKNTVNHGEPSSELSSTLDDDGLSLYDFFQIILVTLFTFSKTSYSFRQELNREKNRNNQNCALYYLLNLAQQQKSFLDLFFKTKESGPMEWEEDQPLSIPFAYLLSKFFFSLETPKVLQDKEQPSQLLPVIPKIYVMKELPEVKIIQILKNTRNKVFLCSATRGFHQVHSGQFSEDFFKAIEENPLQPQWVKIFKREGQVDNPMPLFTERRAQLRRSIQIHQLSFCYKDINDTSSASSSSKALQEYVNLKTYAVKEASSTDPFSFQNTALTLSEKEYPLIQTAQRHSWQHLLKNIKRSPSYQRLNNAMKSAEIDSVLRSMIHAFEHEEHALIYTLSNRFYHCMKEDPAFLSTLFPNRSLVVHQDEFQHYKVVEFEPVASSSRKIRIICYDAALSKNDLSPYFIQKPGTIIVVISSYASAGAGLNFTITDAHSGQEKDFQALYLAHLPYWSAIKNNNAYQALNNLILMTKKWAHSGSYSLSRLNDWSTDYSTRELLNHEHRMDIVKTLVQALGRIERRDSPVDSHVYILENGLTPTFQTVMKHYYDFYQAHLPFVEKTVINNLSMMNRSVLSVAHRVIDQWSMTDSQCSQLEILSEKHDQHCRSFFEQDFPRMMNHYRNSHPDYEWFPVFNHTLRQYTQPHQSLVQLLQTFIQNHASALKKAQEYLPLQRLLQHLEVDRSALGLSSSTPILFSGHRRSYTDLRKGVLPASDQQLFNYSQHYLKGKTHDSFLNNLFDRYQHSSGLSHLPSPYLIPLIKGNLGEAIMEDYLTQHQVAFNQLDVLFSPALAHALYELFDYYIVKGQTLYAIDIKNWNLYNDAGALKLLKRLPDKIALITNRPEFKGYRFHFIYLNMHVEFNQQLSDSLMDYLGGFQEVHYFNFVLKEPYFVNLKNKSQKRDGDHYVINPAWLNLMQIKNPPSRSSSTTKTSKK